MYLDVNPHAIFAHVLHLPSRCQHFVIILVFVWSVPTQQYTAYSAVLSQLVPSVMSQAWWRRCGHSGLTDCPWLESLFQYPSQFCQSMTGALNGRNTPLCTALYFVTLFTCSIPVWGSWSKEDGTFHSWYWLDRLSNEPERGGAILRELYFCEDIVLLWCIWFFLSLSGQFHFHTHLDTAFLSTSSTSAFYLFSLHLVVPIIREELRSYPHWWCYM